MARRRSAAALLLLLALGVPSSTALRAASKQAHFTQARAFSRRTTSPVAATDPFSFADPNVLETIKQGSDTIKQGLGIAVPAVEQGVRATVLGIQAAAPEVQKATQSALELSKQGLDAAAPVVKQGVDTAAPKIKQAIDVAAPVIKQGVDTAVPVVGNAVGGAVGSAGSLVRSALTPEQLRVADEAARVGSQVGEVAGSVTNAAGKMVQTAAPAVQKGLEKGVPAAGKLAGDLATGAGKAIQDTASKAQPVLQPVIDDLMDDGDIRPQTLEGLWVNFNAGGNALLRDFAAGLREVANVFDDEPAAVKAASRPAGQLVPSVKEVTDDLAGSLVRASAPYVFGGGLLLVALEALRELVEPLETVVKQVLSVLVLAAITRVAYVNWDTIYLAYQVVMGDKPLVKL